MTLWSAREIFGVLVVSRRLGLLLLAVGVYCVTAAVLIEVFPFRVSDWASATSLLTTLILSLLMSFRNGAAYDRWWEARKLWGQLVNDSRNLAAKCAALVPAEALLGPASARPWRGLPMP